MKRRPCWVEISSSAFEENYRLLVAACDRPEQETTAAPIELLAIVKANAYGHGLSICAPLAVRAGAHWLGVTSVEEGVAARAICPDAEILVIGGPFAGQGGSAVSNRLTSVVWEPWQLDELEAAASSAGDGADSIPVHLELDSGMSRQGVGAADLDAVLARFTAGSPLRLDGLLTHLYAADESDGGATRAQFAVLEQLVERVLNAGLRPNWLHVGNSAALLAGEVTQALRALCTRYGLKPMMRPGLALYGVAPEFYPDEPPAASRLRAKLERVLEWKTTVVTVRSITPGQVVGYNGTFVATEPMRLALLAVGYADGLNRALSNRGSVLIAGHRAPIVGRISMDQTVVDVTEIPEVAAGDEVTLIGRQKMEIITAEDHARWAGTIPWEIFTSISARVARWAFEYFTK
jgi:alanine racemase